MAPNPAKLDSFQYPPEGYSVQSSFIPIFLGCLTGIRPSTPKKTIETFWANSPHTPQISTPQLGINSDFENPLQEGINSDVSDRGSNLISAGHILYFLAEANKKRLNHFELSPWNY